MEQHTPKAICFAWKRNRLWFCVHGTALVRTYPQARRLAEGV